MLGIFVLLGCVLMTCAGPPVTGYSLGTLSGGRGQEYSSGYRTSGFVGMKDSQSEFADQPRGSLYASAGTHRQGAATSASGRPTSGSGYSSDAGYSDAVSSSSSGFGGHSSSQEPLTSSSSSSYSSNEANRVSSTEVGSGSYSPAGSSTGLGGYSSVAGTNGNQVGSTYADYTAGASSHAASTLGGFAERAPAEYPVSSHQSPSYASYSLGGPKASAYASAINSHRGHALGSYSSNPGISFMSGGHHPGGPSASFYSSAGGHPGVSSGSGYPSLSSILAGMHGGGHSNYIHGSTGHRPSPISHMFSSSSNISPSYTSRGPSPGYFSNSPHPRGGSKIILVKDGSGGHLGHMYPGEQGSFNGGMFGGAGTGYKIRSVASGPSYGPSVGGGYGSGSSGGYTGGAGHPSSNHGGGGGLFSFL